MIFVTIDNHVSLLLCRKQVIYGKQTIKFLTEKCVFRSTGCPDPITPIFLLDT